MTGQLAAWHTALEEIVNGAHLATASELTRILDDATARLGVSTQLYLVDMAQRQLCPVIGPAEGAIAIDASLAGRSFRLTQIVAVEAGPETGDRPALWLPVVNGTERLGVARMALPAGTDPHDKHVRDRCWVLAGLIGHLVMSKLSYSDLFHLVRRTQPMSVASELLWQLLPPQTFACPEVVITAVMEPYNRVGGDGYDYSVDPHRAWFAVFDAMGHDLTAGLTSTLALAATRNARRSGLGLIAAADLADEAILGQADSRLPPRFATAVLAELDINTGVLRYLNAGHPPPVLLRANKMVKTLEGPLRLPLGLAYIGKHEPRLGREQLQPGDRVLLYTDGVTEARNADRQTFGLDRLVDLTERHQSAGLAAPETLRRISHAVLEHQKGRLQDDATLLLLEWSADTAHSLLPDG